MNFLIKAASILIKITSILDGFAPLVPAATPGVPAVLGTVQSELTQMFNVVVQAEVFGQVLKTPGPDKARAAAPALAQLILTSTFFSNKKIADPTKFQAAVTAMGGNLADILNSLDHSAADEK